MYFKMLIILIQYILALSSYCFVMHFQNLFYSVYIYIDQVILYFREISIVNVHEISVLNICCLNIVIDLLCFLFVLRTNEMSSWPKSCCIATLA